MMPAHHFERQRTRRDLRQSGDRCDEDAIRYVYITRGLGAFSRNVRFWHKADIPRLSPDVRFWV
jgi:hypothetical protein